MRRDDSLRSWLYGRLRRAIESGELAHGTDLPSQAELMSRYGVSMNTVRDAMIRLAEIGRVITSQGRRTRVHMPEPSHELVVGRLAASGVAEPVRPYVSLRPEVDHRWVEHVCAVLPGEARLLGLPAGAAVVRRTVLAQAGAEVVMTSSSFVPQGVAARSDGWQTAQLGDLAVTGLAVDYASPMLRARVPTIDEAELLGAVPGVPVLALYRRCRLFRPADPGRVALGCVVVLARADRVAVRLE